MLCANSFFHSYSGQDEFVISRAESAREAWWLEVALAHTSEAWGGGESAYSQLVDLIGSGEFQPIMARVGPVLKASVLMNWVVSYRHVLLVAWDILNGDCFMGIPGSNWRIQLADPDPAKPRHTRTWIRASAPTLKARGHSLESNRQTKTNVQPDI